MVSGDIDILLGQDNVWKIQLDNTIINSKKGYAIKKTKLGWSFCGATPNSNELDRLRQAANAINCNKVDCIDSTQNNCATCLEDNDIYMNI